MFDIGATELLLIAIVALVVIGPKDLPRAMRTVGNWVGKARATTRHFRTGIDSMIREAELEEEQKKWAAENARIMREHPAEAIDGETPTALAAPEKTVSADDAVIAEKLKSAAVTAAPRNRPVQAKQARMAAENEKKRELSIPPEAIEPEFSLEEPAERKAPSPGDQAT